VVGRVTFAAPGDLATPTGGFVYDRRVIAELERLDWRVDFANLGEGFPWPSRERRQAAEARLAATPAGEPLVIDGLAFGVLPDAAARLCRNHPLIALVHHPLAMESGLSRARAASLRASERAALALTARIVVTSPSTARLLVADYDVPADRIDIAPPGVDPAPAASGSEDGVVRLISVGAVTPRKGYEVLIAALASIADLPWRLAIVGDLGRDPACAARLGAEIRRRGLSERIELLGAVSAKRLDELYLGADLFALASRHEGYGMAFSEAIARGLPVIGTTGGAIPETVPAGAGALVEPGDVEAMAIALRRLIENPGERRRMAGLAREAAREPPRWRDAGAVFARALARAIPASPAAIR
jgi:glycosyltransferase involved in cell wall biosynthesis